MTATQFRKLAMRMPETAEASHMEHPDFRVGGKIFATLGYPDTRHGVVRITPEEQRRLMLAKPDVFSRAAGKWGLSGYTVVALPKADERTVAAAIASAWRHRAPARLRKVSTPPAAAKGATGTAARKSEVDKRGTVHADTKRYNAALAPADRAIAKVLAVEIARALPEAENKIWHAHPVWFLDGNPIVGYSRLKDAMRLLFWSGQSFKTKGLKGGSKFKDAEVRYTSADQIETAPLRRWLAESRDVQWDYKNIVRRKGRLERLK